MINVVAKKDRLIKRMLLCNFFAIGVVLIIVAPIAFLLFKDRIMPYIQIMFSDFTQIMQSASSANPYQDPINASYPPIAILIIYFPCTLISRDILHLSHLEILQTPQFWISFGLFYTFFFVVAVLMLKKLVRFKEKGLAYFFLVLLSSGMFLYMVARGNIILSAFVFLLVFLVFYKSENKKLRELALICLALAGAIKIYPLFFGVLILKDKKFFSSIRVAIYFALMFLVPFLFFDGGFSNISLFLKNLGSFSLSSDRLLNIINMSLNGFVYKIFYIIGLTFNVSLTATRIVVSVVAIALIAIAAIVSALISKNIFSACVICATVMILIPPVSYYYSAIFMIIPLAEFLNKYESFNESRRKFYSIFFISIMCGVCFLFCGLLSPLLIAALLYETNRNIKNYKKEKQSRIYIGG